MCGGHMPAISQGARAVVTSAGSGIGIRVTALCPTFVKTNIVRNGRMPAATSSAAARMMAKAGVSPESVVRKTLDGLDRGHLYVVPQLEARAVWWLKRFAPSTYARGAGLFGRMLPREPISDKE